MRVVQYIHNKIVHSLREIYLILAVHQGTHYYCTLTLAWTGCYLLFVGRSTQATLHSSVSRQFIQYIQELLELLELLEFVYR